MAKKNSYILGVSAYDHDVSACLLRNGEIAYGIAKERITRFKHDSGFYKEAIDYCLAAEGITLGDVDLIVRNCYILPVEDMEKRLLFQHSPSFLGEDERARSMKHPLFLSQAEKVVTVSHHLAHAYSAFAACPFDDGAVMVVDGVGSYSRDVTESYPASDKTVELARESESYYRFKGSEIEALKKVWMEPVPGYFTDDFFNMPGLGALYSRVSTYIFDDWNKCGEVMGLAPYGRSGEMKPIMKLKDGKLHVPEFGPEFDQPYIKGNEDWEERPSLHHWQDMAWQIQDDTERVLIERARWLREETGAKNLVLAGGVALNCVANGRIEREAGFDNVWIQPAAGDDGIAIGCAYYGHLALQKQKRSYVIKDAFLGIEYKDEDIEDVPAPFVTNREIVKTHSKDICKDTAKLLSEGQVFGWFQGRSEFGPRALGNRSLLADPRTPEMKDILNKRVKHRQAFRPFAPIVLAERAGEVFEDGRQSPFMLIAKGVRSEWQDKIPAVVHVDGSARVQTVTEDVNPRLYRLLREFDALTGVPVLLNTSFNIRGEPIVETPVDALNCFLTTGIDYLAFHDTLIEKSRFHQLFGSAISAYFRLMHAARALKELKGKSVTD